jgi:hypothetical protein
MDINQSPVEIKSNKIYSTENDSIDNGHQLLLVGQGKIYGGSRMSREVTCLEREGEGRTVGLVHHGRIVFECDTNGPRHTAPGRRQQEQDNVNLT